MISDLPVIESAPSNSSAPSVGKSTFVILGSFLGMLAPFACAVHCAAMPFVVAWLPALGLSFLAGEVFHRWTVMGCLAIAVCAFIPGFRKHRRLTPVIVGCVGLTMISFAAFGLAGECCPATDANGKTAASTETSTKDSCCPSEGGVELANGSTGSPKMVAAGSPLSMPWLGLIGPWLAPVGGVLLVAGHLLNRRQCGCCSSEVAEGSSALSFCGDLATVEA